MMSHELEPADHQGSEGFVVGARHMGGRQPRYVNEDTSPTSRMEIMGWYCYGIAAEVFAVCGVGSFLPVTIESLAREQGVLLSDRTTSCIKSALPVNATTSLPSIISRHSNASESGQCIVSFFGAEVNSASYALYTFSLAVFVQALVLVSFSSIADHGDYRKRLLLGFGFGGSTAVMLFLLVGPPIFVIGSLLAIISISCLGSSFVVLNSFLPLLVANDPVIAEAKKDIALDTFPSPSDDGPDAGDSLFDHDAEIRNEAEEGAIRLDTPSAIIPNRLSFSLPTLSPGFGEMEKKIAPELQLSTRISSRGIALGYAAAVVVQIISIAVLLAVQKMTSSTTLPLRIILFLVGLWWFLFTIPVSLWLRDRPGPPLQAIQTSANPSRLRSLLTYTVFAWSSLFRTMRLAFRLRQVRVFLLAWFLLSDAVATIGGTAILFAKTELRMGTPAIALISIVVTLSGILGAFSWPLISARYGLRASQTILCCIFLFELIPLWGLAGYVPLVRRLGFLGIQQAWEVFPLSVIHGFVMGGLSSYCRAFFAGLIPPGSEAAFYALYAITDKGSSAVGPAVVARIIDTTGEIRMAFVFLAVLVLLPVPLIWSLDAESGKRDALNMAAALRRKEHQARSGGVAAVVPAEVDRPGEGAGDDEEAEGLLADLVDEADHPGTPR